jgi:hypothetical protein
MAMLSMRWTTSLVLIAEVCALVALWLLGRHFTI